MSSEASASLLPDQRQFGRYTLLYRFASGGMAHLYVARFTGPDGFEKLVAIKLIHEHLTNEPAFVKMFIDEARLASAISHANVAHIIELGKVGRTYYIAMEYVEGESVSALIRRTKPSLRCSARNIANAAAGLHAAHELKTRDGVPRQAVHRDVSPQNLLVSYEGQVKVVDFGVARARGMLHDTDGGTVKGKFAYMAPEQATSKPVDRRADIFSLGIVLYEMTTRRRLFKGENDAETLRKVLDKEIKAPTKLVGPAYPQSLEQAILKALSRDPEGRFQTARELQTALENFIIESGGAYLPADVGELMAKVFADRIETKREILRKCERDFAMSVPEVDLISTSSSMPTMSTTGVAPVVEVQPVPEPLARPGRLRAVLIVVALAVLIAGALLYLVVLRPGKEPDETTAAATTQTHPDAAAKIKIGIKATPMGASIVLAGEAVTNPYRSVRPRGAGEVQAVISAPGHKMRRLQVPLSSSSNWEIGLEREVALPDAAPAVAPPPKDAPPRREKPRPRPRPAKPKRKGVADDDVFKDNPYGR
jgi:hypothetical protein